jgi:hypothetical protein
MVYAATDPTRPAQVVNLSRCGSSTRGRSRSHSPEGRPSPVSLTIITATADTWSAVSAQGCPLAALEIGRSDLETCGGLARVTPGLGLPGLYSAHLFTESWDLVCAESMPVSGRDREVTPRQRSPPVVES